MVKHIDIEYCGAWGYGGPATRLKKEVEAAFAGVQVSCHSAGKSTSVITVSWIDDNGNKKVLWSKGRADTENSHKEIVQLLKDNQWVMRNLEWMRSQSINEGELLNFGALLNNFDWNLFIFK